MNVINKRNDLNQIFNNNFINNIQNNNNYNNNFDNQLEGESYSSFNNKIENSSENNFYNQRVNHETSQSQSLMPTFDTSISSNQNNFDNNFNNSNIKKNNFNRYQLEEYYKNFVQEQLGIINEYEEKLNDSYYNFNYNQLLNEKKETLKQIETSQNNFKNNIGILPMKEQYNKCILNILDMILEQKVKEIKSNNYNNNEANNINVNSSNNNNIIIKVDDNADDNLNNQNFKSTGTFNLDEISLSEKKNINEFGIDESQNERDLIGCRYKSKYEELRESMINGNDISDELKTSMSLAGISKFVVQNKLIDNNKINYSNDDNDNDNFNELYVTWKGDNFNNNKISNKKIKDINSINNKMSNKNSIQIRNNNIQIRESNQTQFKIEEINNNDEMEEKKDNLNNNYIVGDSSDDINININPYVSSIRNKNNSANNNVSFNNNINLDDSYLNKINDQLPKKPQNIKLFNEDKNNTIFLVEDNNNQNNNNYNPSLAII